MARSSGVAENILMEGLFRVLCMVKENHLRMIKAARASRGRDVGETCGRYGSRCEGREQLLKLERVLGKCCH